MKKDVSGKQESLFFWLKTALIEIAVTLVFIAVFAAVMYFFELNKNMSTVFATLSVAIGSLTAAFSAAKKVGCKGYLIGLIVGGITFVLIALISFIVDDGALTFNTLFHLIIIMLSSLIGGIMGVNKKGKSYIK